MVRRSVLLILILFLLVPVSAQDSPSGGFSTDIGEAVLLTQLVTDHGIRLQWDAYGRSGVLTNGTTYISFSLDAPWMIINYSDIEPIVPFRARDGAIFVPRVTAASISDKMVEKPVKIHRIAAVVIDPGHGGKDPGANHVHAIDGERVSVVEKEINLTVSLQLYEMLTRRYADRDIIITRETDEYLMLEERTEIANSVARDLEQNESMIFLSVHANASLNSKAKGFEVWYLPPDYPARQDLVDPSELDLDEGQEDLIPILNAMKEEEFTVESVLLAKDILAGLETELGDLSVNRGLMEESWFVVRNARMAAVLIELGFVTNPAEAELLTGAQHLQRLSRGIYNGVIGFIEYFEETSGFVE
jgi:N-acetylmuramoyl-L-alanine amidase